MASALVLRGCMSVECFQARPATFQLLQIHFKTHDSESQGQEETGCT